jgi:ATP synthase subunit 6
MPSDNSLAKTFFNGEFFAANPLEQFQLVPLIPINFGVDLRFTNRAFFMMLRLGFFLGLNNLVFTNGLGTVVPNRWQRVVENIYTFLYGMIQDTIGNKGLGYFPFIFVIFTFILRLNLIGMVPYRFTATRHIIVTFCLALGVFLGRCYILVRMHKMKAFAFFLPPGVPFAMMPFIVVLEVLSLFITVVRLSVRLFANMMSGHIMLKVLIGFA